VIFSYLQGDTRVYIYELVPESPYFIECSSFNSPEPHKVPDWLRFTCISTFDETDTYVLQWGYKCKNSNMSFVIFRLFLVDNI